MALTRRQFLAAAAATGTLAAQPKSRTGPLICLYSRLLPGVEYFDLGPILSGMGFDGCDLSVQPGGTVQPQLIAVDLVRAIESLQGHGLEVPVITTNFVSPADPWAQNVLYVTGGTGVPFFRGGYWRLQSGLLGAMKPQMIGLASAGRAFKMAMGVPNTVPPDLLADLDPNWVGYDFDPSRATPELPLEKAMPRIKMFLLRDAKPQNGRLAACPLGEGIVDWPMFFETLAKARFSGPLSLQLDYPVEDPVVAVRRDLAFARKLLSAAYQKVIDSTSHPASSAPSAGSSTPSAPRRPD